MEGKAKLSDPSKAKTWLFSVIRYTAVDELRKPEKMLPLAEGHELIDMPVEIDYTDYDAIIKLLPSMQQQVILMVFYHQMTIEQSAEVLQIQLGTARTHYARGKKKLKELILKSQTEASHGK